jgi:hypothetical protein
MGHTDHLWSTLNATSEWIRFGDAKAVAALTADAVLVAALAQTVFGSQHQSWPVLLFAIISVLAAATSGILALVAVIPKFNAGPPRSVLFFNGIAEYPDIASFKEESSHVLKSEDELASCLQGLIYTMSHHANHKYRLVRLAVGSLIVGAILALVPLAFAGPWVSI